MGEGSAIRRNETSEKYDHMAGLILMAHHLFWSFLLYIQFYRFLKLAEKSTKKHSKICDFHWDINMAFTVHGSYQFRQQMEIDKNQCCFTKWNWPTDKFKQVRNKARSIHCFPMWENIFGFKLEESSCNPDISSAVSKR